MVPGRGYLGWGGACKEDGVSRGGGTDMRVRVVEAGRKVIPGRR